MKSDNVLSIKRSSSSSQKFRVNIYIYEVLNNILVGKIEKEINLNKIVIIFHFAQVFTGYIHMEVTYRAEIIVLSKF